jgi:hypothetical protein
MILFNDGQSDKDQQFTDNQLDDAVQKFMTAVTEGGNGYVVLEWMEGTQGPADFDSSADMDLV